MTDDSALPNAENQNPSCGCCIGETRFTDDAFECDDCLLTFDPLALTASFTDPETPVCGYECDNWWHGDHKIKRGQGYRCGTCALPAGHTSFHWTGCKPIVIAGGA